jgi:hypothetical protein
MTLSLGAQDSFVFATGAVHKPKSKSPLKEWFSEILSKGSHSREQGTKVPVSTLVSHGWNRRNVGWDHSRLKWHYPVWPKLDSNLDRSSDKSTMKWILDWKDDDDDEVVPTEAISVGDGLGGGWSEVGVTVRQDKGKGKQQTAAHR